MVVLVRYFGDTSWCPGMAGHGSTIISVFVFIMSSRREGGQGEGRGGDQDAARRFKPLQFADFIIHRLPGIISYGLNY